MISIVACKKDLVELVEKSTGIHLTKNPKEFACYANHQGAQCSSSLFA